MRKEDIPVPADAWELSAQLRMTSQRLWRTFREKAGPNQLGASHTAVLGRLLEGSSTASELARAEGMRPQSMSETIAELTAAGLVSGAPDPADGRRTLISLTKAGWEAVRVSRTERQDWLAHLVAAKLSTAERRHLILAMRLLDRLFERGT